jgi:hypothetical protein
MSRNNDEIQKRNLQHFCQMLPKIVSLTFIHYKRLLLKPN